MELPQRVRRCVLLSLPYTFLVLTSSASSSIQTIIPSIHTHFSLPLATQSTYVASLLQELATQSRNCAQAVEWMGDQKEEEGDLEASREVSFLFPPPHSSCSIIVER
jgi:hypothetical protein